MPRNRFIDRLDAALARLLSLARWLVLPVSLLLFLQWPLRDLLHKGSREANDLGQICFALYIVCAVTAATRARSHLAIDVLARHYGAPARLALSRAAAALGVIPWALFVLFAGRGYVWNSAMQMERFADTLNPGYFLVKAAIFILALMMLAQSLLDIARSAPAGEA